jgi:hypothetical protein
LKLIEQAHFQVKKELVFYEKIMAPEKQANGLVIDGVTLTKSQSPAHYRFQVVLVQQVLRKRYVKGFIELTIIGSLNNKPTSIALSELRHSTRKSYLLAFNTFKL